MVPLYLKFLNLGEKYQFQSEDFSWEATLNPGIKNSYVAATKLLL